MKLFKSDLFYDDSILSGTKTDNQGSSQRNQFYDDSILSGTKTHFALRNDDLGFMMTQFFQVLKHQIPLFA